MISWGERVFWAKPHRPGAITEAGAERTPGWHKTLGGFNREFGVGLPGCYTLMMLDNRPVLAKG